MYRLGNNCLQSLMVCLKRESASIPKQTWLTFYFLEKNHTYLKKYQHNKYIFLAVQSYLCQTKRLVFDESNKPDNQADHHDHHDLNNPNDPNDQMDWVACLFLTGTPYVCNFTGRVCQIWYRCQTFHYLPLLSKLLPWAMSDCLVVFHDLHSHCDNFLS